jgi:hypothetical protein
MDRLAALALPALIACLARGQTVLTLTDGTTTRGTLAGIAADGSFSWQGTGGPLKVPAARVVGIDSGDAFGAPAPESFRIDLSSGDSLIGRIEDGSADDLRLRSPAFGDLTISLDDVVGIWNLALPRSPESLPPVQGDAETLYVDRDGRVDSLPGTLERVGKSQLSFSSVAGPNRPFSYAQDRVIAVRWSGAATRPREAPAVIHLKDGSRLSGALQPSDGASLAIKLVAGPLVVLDPRWLKSIAIRNQGLRYLSDVDGPQFEETPLFSGALAQGMKRDRGLRSGQPLRIGHQTFTKGLLLPARSRITFPLDGGFARFVAMAGADANAEGHDLSGSVKARVLVDGKPLWTSGVLRAGQAPEAVDVGGLAGARELAIEVDFADSFDAGARAVFGNAMLIK